jgi:hypothetical protein
MVEPGERPTWDPLVIAIMRVAFFERWSLVEGAEPTGRKEPV